MKKNTLIFGIVGLLFVALGLIFGIKRLDGQPAENQGAADLLSHSLKDTSGELQPLSQWRNKILVVNFWATWCAPCVEEMPELSALQNEVGAKNIQLLGVGIDSLENIRAFGTKLHITYPLYAAGMEGSDLARRLGNTGGGVPFTVLIDQNGRIRKAYLGRLKIQELRQDLASL